MTQEKTDVVIIGAGIVGCTIAYELSSQGYNPIVLEQGPRIAEGITSRNSGVIHAGIYYPPNSLKAELCIKGNALLYEWCSKYKVPHLKTGKWIVAFENEAETLHNLYKNAENSGARGLSWISELNSELNEQGILADCAILSSETGIVDPFEYARSFQIIAEENGASFIMSAQVYAIDHHQHGSFNLHTSRGNLTAEVVINAAGLNSDTISSLVGVSKYRLYPCKGDYFRLKSRRKYEKLVYPTKAKGAPGLGIHLTIGLDGTYRLGPDTTYINSKDDFSYPANQEEKRVLFWKAASKHLKDLRLEDIAYDSSGIRPKLRSPEEAEEKDFVISEDLPGFINLIGIESPGLTASRALSKKVATMIKGSAC